MKKYIVPAAILVLLALLASLFITTPEKVAESDRLIVTLSLPNETLLVGSSVDVNGHAVYESGNPVSYGSVRVTTAKASHVTKTDVDGNFGLNMSVPNGLGIHSVTVEVSHNGTAGSASKDFQVVMSFRVLWEYDTGGISTSVYTGNLDDDSQKEVVVYNNRLVSYLTVVKDGKLMWERNISGIIGTGIPTSSGTNLLIDDVDNDKRNEAIAASTCMGRCPTYIYLYDGDGNLKWRYGNSTTGSIHNIYIADLDNDEKKEILYGTYEGDVYALNDDGSIRWVYRTDAQNYSTDEDGWSGVWRVTASDLNNDGVKEVVAGSGNHNIYVLSNNGTLLWNYTTEGKVYRVSTFDLDGDGLREIMASVSGGARMTGKVDSRGVRIAKPVPSYLYVLSSGGKFLFKRAIGKGGYSFFVEGADLNGDGKGEIVVGYSGKDGINVFDSDGSLLWKISLNGPIDGLSISDLNNDGMKEIIAGSSGVHVLNHNGTLLWKSAKMPVTMIHTDDTDSDGYMEIVLLSSGRVYLFGAGF